MRRYTTGRRMIDAHPLRVLGHAGVVGPLRRSVRDGRVAHAYLISGPPRVGKSTLARWLAGALCCPAPEPPCAACSTCRRVAAGKHPDVETLAPGGPCDEPEHDHDRDGSRDVRICQVRRAERLLSLAPFEAHRRVVVVDPADALNAQSADAFLKTLEEPPAGAVIVLVAAEPAALPETVRSRCRHLALRALPTAEVERLLAAEVGVPAERAALLARLSGGHIGWALAALEDPAFLERRAQQLDRIAELAERGRPERFAYAEELAARFPRARDDVYGILSLWVDWWRDVFRIAAGDGQGIVNVDRRAELEAAARRYDPAAVARFLHALRACRRDLETNVNARLALEHLMLAVPAPLRS
jgi:DNA polymerase-3 subunit delta'